MQSPDRVSEFRQTNQIVVEPPDNQSQTTILDPVFGFSETGFPDDILETLSVFTTPSPIQAQAWPYVMSGQDVVGVSQTGTGKTLAFLLPAICFLRAQLAHEALGNAMIFLCVCRQRESVCVCVHVCVSCVFMSVESSGLICYVCCALCGKSGRNNNIFIKNEKKKGNLNTFLFNNNNKHKQQMIISSTCLFSHQPPLQNKHNKHTTHTKHITASINNNQLINQSINHRTSANCCTHTHLRLAAGSLCAHPSPHSGTCRANSPRV
eukprot:c12635_g1_i1.p1 GENE.c12635_g1_i1~~c12635_g1_i1.p1  ORF type:complete len:265 (+),score=41.46 c12635_g1_i1:185-979(+)